MIEIQELAFGWNKQKIIDIPELQIGQGETLFILGRSGTGKTTLLNLIAGFLKPWNGKIKVNGTLIESLTGKELDNFRRTYVSFIFQNLNVMPFLSAMDNVMLANQFSDNNTGLEARSKKILTHLGLNHDEISRKCSGLSRGQNQRVAVARALAREPAVLLADEPTASLDEESKTSLMNFLIQECERLGTTLLFVSHDRSMAPMFHREFILQPPVS